MLLVRPLRNVVLPFRPANATYQKQQPVPFVRTCVHLPRRFCCALQNLQASRFALRGRQHRAGGDWAVKADTGKADAADSLSSKDKHKLDKADSKADSKAADPKTDNKAERSKGSKTDKPEHPKPDVSATASQGLKPVHLAQFFIILGTGLMFLAVLLWFTADIRFQQACVKVLRRLFKTVALRQVMGILGAMTFVRLGLEPMVKLLRRLFRAPGTWEKSSEFYILREVDQALFCANGCLLALPVGLTHS